MTFHPIAIVGQGCVLPGAHTPEALWSLVRAKRSALTPAPSGLWRLDPSADRQKLAGEIASDVGGHVEGFDFDPSGLQVDAARLRGLDPVFLWTLHAARDAVRSAGFDPLARHARGTVVLGNLSYPTPGLVDLALAEWSRSGHVDPRNRFMSGLPAHLVAEALGFVGRAFCVDAACASSLYAIKLACDRLQDGRADLALAGGVNAADDLFLHGGFSALHALSPTGQSRPFHRDADGLVPAQGAAVLVLERLEDALAAGRPVLGVIRGIGLSNDGRSRGLMVPAEEGQARALRAAYVESGLSPSDISLVECHATGTVVGDGAEVRSLRAVFAGARGLPLGSLKSNVGHLITASGAAAIIKVMAAMRDGVRPATLYADAPIDELGDGMFRLLADEEPWACAGPRRAAISNFGFGGNNAHLVLEQWAPGSAPVRAPAPPSRPAIAVVAQCVLTGAAREPGAFEARVLGLGDTATTEVDTVHIDAAGLRFPPADLKAALPQQLLLLEAAQRLGPVLDKLTGERASVLVGMQTDAEVARHAVRWCGAPGWVGSLSDALRNDALTAPVVIGCMPNIVANRLSHQLDVQGPSYTVSSEELSGVVALELAVRALERGELDAAAVGAVDLAHEPVQRAAARAVLPATRHTQGDAAVLLVLKREADAIRDGDSVLARVAFDGESAAGWTVSLTGDEAGLTPTFGHAHAASGLLHVAAAVTACHRRALPSRVGPMPWLPDASRRDAAVHVTALGGQSATATISASDATAPVPVFLGETPGFGAFGADSVEGLISALRARTRGTTGALRVAIVGESRAEYEARVDRAIVLLSAATLPGTLEDGVHFGRGALHGELAFVYTGAAGAYAHMGRDLALALPELVDRFGARAHTVRAAAGWVYSDASELETTPEEKLWGASYLGQLHTELTRHLLGLSPTVSIGYCSGETNALFALGAWDGLDAFRAEVSGSHVYDQHLCGELRCLRAAWKLPDEARAEWSTWRIRAAVAEVRAAVAEVPRVNLVIINSPTDVVIAGDPEGCARVGAKFPRKAARTPGYDFVMHCPEAREYESRWRALHTRPTNAVPGVRFYTHATLSSYAPSTETCADAMTGQAMHTVDFPALIERAYADGVRVFVEHGPHAGCTKWIGEILGKREHVAVALDRYGQSSLVQALEGAARLFAAGLPVQVAALEARLAPPRSAPEGGAKRTLKLALAAHPPAVGGAVLGSGSVSASVPVSASVSASVRVPGSVPVSASVSVSAAAPASAAVPVSASARSLSMTASPRSDSDDDAWMAPAPTLASVFAPASPAALAPRAPVVAPLPAVTQPSAPAAQSTAPYAPLPTAAVALVDQLAAHQAQLAELHRAFLKQQIELQTRFVQTTLAPLAQWARAGAPAAHAAFTPIDVAGVESAPRAFAPAPTHLGGVDAPLGVSPPSAPRAESPRVEPAPPRPVPKPASAVRAEPTPPRAAPATPPAPASTAGIVTRVAPPRTPTGLRLDRKQLEVHASGKISEIFGPLFAQQDGYARQVRMPEPPLLLADRVLGIEGEPGALGTGTIWTETDVRPGAFYLHEGRMPAGVMVESGQADLMLISWLGADFLNKGERVYRLLGCELRSHGGLPKIGDTLHYEILVDGHAEQDGVRLFFFHYNCWVNGELRMSVRSGQAGFFTTEELANSAGVLWSAETAQPQRDARLDPPVVACTKSQFSYDDVTALIEGRISDCFGPGYERAATHTRTPTIAGEKMRLLDDVTHYDPAGGPWKRGYLRARLALEPTSWFFDGHFKNDPCMPGTLMLEGGLQAMQILMTALGHTLGHDGSRFEPVPEQTYSLRCRGQATPASKEVIYEIFVEEVIGGPEPMLYADILGSVDGRKAFHCKRMGLRLVPAWPLDEGRLVHEIPQDARPVAVVDGFRFDYASLLACAWGKPSSAFGPMYARFDSPRRVARLPGPPYHFMSRVTHVEGPIGGMKVGSVAVIDYDVPRGEWYFEQNGCRTMPFAVMLETALQPCGWLASYVGGALGSEQNLYFRNLDGTGTQHREITEDIGTLTVTTKLTSISNADSIVIMAFDVVMRAGDEDVYSLKTVFGFFPGDTMANQAGLPTTDAQREARVAPSDVRIELGARPARFFQGTLRLGTDRLVMIDRLTGLWRDGGKKGLGRVRAEKDVAATQWFFKAHFFQDPVQPGSLGLEAMLQALQALVVEHDLAQGISEPRFETQASGVPMSWKYRGQVIPENHVVVVDVELTEVRREPGSVLVVAEGSLWVDGKRIYECKGLGVRVVSGAPT